MSSETRFNYYSWQSGLDWINGGRGTQTPTVGMHNSAMTIAAFSLDALYAISELYPKNTDAAKLPVLPERTYHGIVTEWDKKQVPLVGSKERPAADADNQLRLDAAAALVDALRPIAAQSYVVKAAAATTAPGGALLNARYPIGMVAVRGIASHSIMESEEPASTLTEPAEAVLVAKLLNDLLPLIDALGLQSVQGVTLNAFAGASAEVKAEITSGAEALKKHQSRKVKIAGGIAVAGLAAAFLYRNFSKPSNVDIMEAA